MGTDFSIRPVGVPVALPAVRPTSDVTTSAVPTELPAPQAPSQPATAAPLTNSNPQGTASDYSQNVVIDRAANTIVYQTIDQQTNQVISQFPDDAVLLARAYYRALDTATLDKSLYDQTA
jgi:hypothetical protein